MASKQIIAFILGAVIVVAGVSAIILFNQQHEPAVSSEADSGNNGNGNNSSESDSGNNSSTGGDAANSDDPTSGLRSYDGQIYYLKFSSALDYSDRYYTNYTLIFDTDKNVKVTAYVNNIQVLSLGYFDAGHQSYSGTTPYTDINNYGLELLKELRFAFTPVEKGTDISFTVTQNSADSSKCDLTFTDGNQPTGLTLHYKTGSGDVEEIYVNIGQQSTVTISVPFTADTTYWFYYNDLIYYSS